MLFDSYTQIYIEIDPWSNHSLVTEADEFSDDFDEPSSGITVNKEKNPNDPPEFMSLRKYHIIQKLHELKNRLDDVNQNSEDLDLLLKFSNELSYNTLVQLSNGIVEYIKTQLKGVKDDEGQQ